MVCNQVVPDFDGTVSTMSSGRNVNRLHRLLSAMNEW